jgi:hypothetical protein
MYETERNGIVLPMQVAFPCGCFGQQQKDMLSPNRTIEQGHYIALGTGVELVPSVIPLYFSQ